MEIKMPDGAVLVTENPEVIDSYINMMGGVEVTEKKQAKKSPLFIRATSTARSPRSTFAPSAPRSWATPRRSPPTVSG